MSNVDCLGMVFENDEARRAYFLEQLAGRLCDPEFRKIEGFPIGSDEDILALSDPPYYTACPNPFIGDFVKHYGKPYDPENDGYYREPFAADVSEGKTSPIYRAYSYHTKVPHNAIVPFILHYTEPGDIVLDGFCGSGMTGVAAQWCGSAPEVYRRKVESDFEKLGLAKPRWGTRRVLLNDLSPAATFIAANYNLPFDVRVFAHAAKRVIDEAEREIGWMYRTVHSCGNKPKPHEDEILKALLGENPCPSWLTLGRIEYTVWSEVFSCPDCDGEVVFTEVSCDDETKRIRDTFPCPHCGSNLSKRRLILQYEAQFDGVLRRTVQTPKRKPLLISYKVGNQRFVKATVPSDYALLERIASMGWPLDVPSVEIPPMCERTRLHRRGITHIHHFFLPRAAHALAALWRKASAHPDTRIRHMLLFFVEQAIKSLSVLNGYNPRSRDQSHGRLPLTYYVPSQIAEVTPWDILRRKRDRLVKIWTNTLMALGNACVSTGSAAKIPIPDSTIDYIFTDPPFGGNVLYSDLNFLVESWYRVITNAAPEVIVDKTKKKGLSEYQHLMQRCFDEYYRVLKPGRWMTVVFNNTENLVWTAIQEAISNAGFVVADVRILDRKQGSFNQVKAANVVKYDLAISAYKPNVVPVYRPRLEAGTVGGVWDFVRSHLKRLPVFVTKNGQAEIAAERQKYLLFSRMVAFHVKNSLAVPLSASEFYAGLAEMFPERDGMYFLPEQAAEYDRAAAEKRNGE